MNRRILTIVCALLLVSYVWADEAEKDSVGYRSTVTKDLQTN